MPTHLVLVRHGESEGNFARSAYKRGDQAYLTNDFKSRPDHELRLTQTGVDQAKAAGAWIQQNILEKYGLSGFDKYFYSPHRRTRETAANLGIDGAQWQLNRLLRERAWGELSGLVEHEHRELYPRNYKWMQSDPLYWTPPGGESVSQVADNRVRELFDTLHRDHDEKGTDSVIVVTHGEFIWATRLVLEYMFNDDYLKSGTDASQKINNCQVVHYTRINPATGEKANHLKWRRSVWPWKTPDEQGSWQKSTRKLLSNKDLLQQVETVPRLFG